MILDILTDPNPILRTKGRELSPADLSKPEFIEFLHNLIETMYAKEGVGIASPQVGESIQVCVIAKDYTTDKKHDLVLINPSWEKKSIKRVWGEEGCLSVPNVFGKVKRCKKILIKAIDQNGKPVKIEAEDFFARVAQHEIDHLNGILFIDKAKDLYEVEKQL